MSAAWAATELWTAGSRIKVLAPNTAKGGFPARVLEERVVAVVIIEPKAEE
jgi:hypothetical protein